MSTIAVALARLAARALADALALLSAGALAVTPA
jgi:hypothetical protein